MLQDLLYISLYPALSSVGPISVSVYCVRNTNEPNLASQWRIQKQKMWKINFHFKVVGLLSPRRIMVHFGENLLRIAIYKAMSSHI